jgi:hypothetical protein
MKSFVKQLAVPLRTGSEKLRQGIFGKEAMRIFGQRN